MQRKKHTMDIRIFLRFLSPYMLVLTVALLTSSIYYVVSRNILVENERDATLSIIRDGINNVDQCLAQTDNLVTILLRDREVSSFFSLPKQLQPANYLQIKQISKKISTYSIYNELFGEIFLYNKNSDVIISSSMATAHSRFFYEGFLDYEGVEYAQWLDELFSSDTITHYYPLSPSSKKNGVFAQTIAEIRLIPYLHNTGEESVGFKGFALVLLDESELKKKFQSSSIVQKGWFCIIDDQNNLLTSTNAGEEEVVTVLGTLKSGSNSLSSLSNGNTTIICETSPYNGWHYVAGIETHLLTQKAEHLKNYYFILLFTAFLGSLVIAVLMARHYSAPMSQIMDELQQIDGIPQKDGFNIFRSLEDGLQQLINDNRNMAELLDFRRQLLRKVFWRKLLRGEFLNQDELESLSSEIDLSISAPLYAVLSFKLELCGNTCSDDLVIYKTISSNIIKNVMGYQNGIEEISDNKIAVLLRLQKGMGRREVSAIAQKILQELLQLDNLRFYVSAGNIYSTLWGVQQSSRQAQEALEYTILDAEEGKVIFYEDLSHRMLNYYYPIELEQRLLNLVKGGEYSECSLLLEQIFDTNFKKLRLSPSAFKQLVYELRGTIFKLHGNILLEDFTVQQEYSRLIVQLESVKNLKTLHSLVDELLSLFCQVSCHKKRSHNDALKNKILQFIEDNYMDSNLSLCSVASQFDMSEKYLSNFFKEQTGIAFSEHLGAMRMKHAVRLLKEGITVEKISISVGYNSANTFYRAFKRFYGVKPSAYRYNQI